MGGSADPGVAPDPAGAKARLRRRMLDTRRARGPGATGSPQAPAQADAEAGDGAEATLAVALAGRVLELPEVAAARCVAAYVSVGGEPDTSELLAAFRARGVRVLLPALRPDLGLDFREYDGTLVPGARGTVEPPPAGPPARLDEADVVIVPAVAADRAGRRLGRGGGSYDRALGAARPTAPVIAVVYDHELVDEVPSEPHDRPVTAVATPERMWRC